MQYGEGAETQIAWPRAMPAAEPVIALPESTSGATAARHYPWTLGLLDRRLISFLCGSASGSRQVA